MALVERGPRPINRGPNWNAAAHGVLSYIAREAAREAVRRAPDIARWGVNTATAGAKRAAESAGEAIGRMFKRNRRTYSSGNTAKVFNQTQGTYDKVGKPKMKKKKRKVNAFKKLKKKVNMLSKTVGDSVSTNLRRIRFTDHLACATGAKAEKGLTWTTTDENAVVTSLRFYNPAAGAGTVVTATPGSTTNMEVRYNIQFKYTMKNNTTHPCKVTYRMMRCIAPTDKGMIAAAAEYIGDSGITYSTTNPLHYVGDGYDGYKRYWKATNCQGVTKLSPGEQLIVYYNRGFRKVNFGEVKQAFEKGRGLEMFIRLEGLVVHDRDTPTNINTGPAQIDIMQDVTVVTKYQGTLQMESRIGDANLAQTVITPETAQQDIVVEGYDL